MAHKSCADDSDAADPWISAVAGVFGAGSMARFDGLGLRTGKFEFLY